MTEYQKLPPIPMSTPELGRRHFPSGSPSDTSRLLSGGFRQSLRAVYQNVFEDDEIISVQLSPDQYTVFRDSMGQTILAGKTLDGRFVLQQQGWLGCTAACAEMLKADHGLAVNKENLTNCSRGDVEIYLKEAGMSLVFTKKSVPDPVSTLADCLTAHGAGALGICGHEIILDKIDLDKRVAIIRDPFHGWSITVKLEALSKRLGQEVEFVQIAE